MSLQWSNLSIAGQKFESTAKRFVLAATPIPLPYSPPEHFTPCPLRNTGFFYFRRRCSRFIVSDRVQ